MSTYVAFASTADAWDWWTRNLMAEGYAETAEEDRAIAEEAVHLANEVWDIEHGED